MRRLRLIAEGGFHNAPPRVFLASDYRGGSWYLTRHQTRLLERHFCGIADCACGTRAQVRGVNGEQFDLLPCPHNCGTEVIPRHFHH